MKRIFFVILFLFFAKINVFAAHVFPEKYYQNAWCAQWNGRQEVKLIDSTRVDCITKNYAIEFDFANKWAEAVGQSLHYSRMTGKKPAIILIIEKNEDFKYYNRVKPLCEKYNIALWYMRPPKAQGLENIKIPTINQDLIIALINYVKELIYFVI